MLQWRRASPPKRAVPEEPPDFGNFTDDLQFLALERPHALAVVRHLVTGLATRYRASPLPAITLELSGVLEYRDVRVYDPAALLAPAEGRLGRRLQDIMPSYVTEQFLRAFHRAKRTREAASMVTTRDDGGGNWRSTIILPKPDLVVVTVTPVVSRRKAIVDTAARLMLLAVPTLPALIGA